jgi:hypothetical protein
LRKISGSIDMHPLVGLVIYLVLYQGLSFLAVEIFDPTCDSFTAGRRQNTFFSCDWHVNVLFDLLLNSFFGFGPMIGPFVTAFLLYIPYRIYRYFKPKGETIARPVSPYGSIEKHKEILIKSGVSEEEANKILDKSREY